MLVATPFLPDKEVLTDFELYAKALSAKGQCINHSLLIITQRQHEEDAIAFVTKAGKLFADAKIEVIDAAPEGGLTGVANAMFKAAVYYFRDYEGLPGQTTDVPMLYNDPTWYPNKQAWLDAIQSEYYSKGCPQVLCRYKGNEAGEKITRGPVLISKEYVKDPPLIPHLPNHVHWRQYLRHELGQLAVPSETIGSGKKSVLKPVRSLQHA